MNSKEKIIVETSEMLKIMAHPVRLCIIKGLLEKGESNVTNIQSCLDTPQSTVSQHLQKLRTFGIIEGRREGVEIFYKVTDKRAARLMRFLFEIKER